MSWQLELSSQVVVSKSLILKFQQHLKSHNQKFFLLLYIHSASAFSLCLNTIRPSKVSGSPAWLIFCQLKTDRQIITKRHYYDRK